MNTSVFHVGEIAVTRYGLLMAISYGLFLLLAILLGKKQGVKAACMGLYGLLAAAIGLFLGRAIYCAVKWEWIFLDELGRFIGVGPLFDFANGGISVVGLMIGALLAAPIAASITKEKPGRCLDAAAIPVVLLFTLARAAEIVCRKGLGNLLENKALCFFPLAIQNSMGDYVLSVGFIEAVLAALVLVSVICLQKKAKRPGTLALYALVLLCLSQILPETFRRDQVLYVFIFARVTHLGLAFGAGLPLICLLVQGAKKGLPAKTIVLEVLGLAAGIGLCIGTIFALDKTNLPKLLVYAVMVISLVEWGFVVCRRIAKEDARV